MTAARRPPRSGWAVGAALPMALAVGLGGCGDKAAPAPPPVAVAVAPVERRDMPFELEATGTVEPLESVAVRAQVGGIVDSVAFEEGDLVHKGQVLFRIDPRAYGAAVRQAEAVLARDRAQAENAQQDVERYQELVAKDYVTAQQFDQVRTTAAALRATVAADQAARR